MTHWLVRADSCGYFVQELQLSLCRSVRDIRELHFLSFRSVGDMDVRFHTGAGRAILSII